MVQQASRRQVLAWGLAAGASLAGPVAALDAEPSLQMLAAAGGRRFGSSVGAGAPGSLAGSFHDPAYRRLLLEECALLVHENALKWYALQPQPGAYNFEPADQVMAFAASAGLDVRGHTLVWNRAEFTPRWLDAHDFGSRPASEAERLLTTHIQSVLARYRGQIRSWDVINETIDPETGALRDTVFSRLLGEHLIDIAFHAVREADPQAQLVYNDYMGWDAGQAVHRDGVLRLLAGLSDRGVPIDALGVQSHVWAGADTGNEAFQSAREAGWRDFLDAVTGLGLDLLVTEFDVNDTQLPYETEARDHAVAELAERYLGVMLSYRETGDILVWGMADHYSWLQTLWPRPDGAAKRPSPYDADFQPKPLRAAIARALRNATALSVETAR